MRRSLSNNCYKCHGPATQKGDLRLDTLEFAQKSEAIIPGKPEKSELLHRVTAKDDDALIEICDRGLGLSDDDFERTFDKFTRGRHTGGHRLSEGRANELLSHVATRGSAY